MGLQRPSWYRRVCRFDWGYHGPPLQGPITWRCGIEPELSTVCGGAYHQIQSGDHAGRTGGGVKLPADIPLQDRIGDTIRWTMQVFTPEGVYGATLRFTLRQGSNGLEPMDIVVEPMAPLLQEGDTMRDIAIDAFNLSRHTNLSLRFTKAAPLITQQEAMQVVRDSGVVWGLGGDFQDKPVTVRALYGQLTLGRPEDTLGLDTGDNQQALSSECAGWVGPCNVPVKRCIEDNCQNTGKVINRIENRPYWIIDYGNTIISHSGCPTCLAQAPYNHTVYAIDAQEKFVLMVWGYTAP